MQHSHRDEEPMILSILLCIIIGSLLWLDRTFVFQLMLSRPIVIGCILGLIMQDVKTGLLVGACLDLLWLNTPPVGAYVPLDDTFCAIVAVPAASVAAIHMSVPAAVGLSLVVSIPTAAIGRRLDSRIRKFNSKFLHPEDKEIYTEAYIDHAMGKAVMMAFLHSLIAISITTAGICIFVYLIHDIVPGFLKSALAILPYISILIGLTGIIRSQRSLKKSVTTFCLGALIVLLITWIP